MQELAELVAVLLGLHVALGLHWFPRSAYVFRAWIGSSAHAIPASVAWGSDKMALFLGPPLPGTGRFHLVELFPLSLGRDAVLADVAHDPNPGGRTPRSGRIATWDEARSARSEGRDLFLDRKRVLVTGSEALASHLARTLRRLAPLEADERERELVELQRRALDEALVRERVDAWTREARTLRRPAIATSAFLFVALPGIGMTLGLAMTWPVLLATALLLQAWSAFAFFRAHRRLEPDERADRARRTFTVALSPLEALRAAEILGRDLLAEFHPLAAGAVLLSRAELEPFAARVLRDALHPMPPAIPLEDPRAIAALRETRERLVRALTAAAKRIGIDLELAAKPPPADADERSYCPRCSRTYTLASGTCPECWDLALVPIGRARA